jgi:hypothetical protein
MNCAAYVFLDREWTRIEGDAIGHYTCPGFPERKCQQLSNNLFDDGEWVEKHERMSRGLPCLAFLLLLWLDWCCVGIHCEVRTAFARKKGKSGWRGLVKQQRGGQVTSPPRRKQGMFETPVV